jgi:hypothetical protein
MICVLGESLMLNIYQYKAYLAIRVNYESGTPAKKTRRHQKVRGG